MLCESLLGALGDSSNNIDCFIVFQLFIFYLINPSQTINTAGKLYFFLIMAFGREREREAVITAIFQTSRTYFLTPLRMHALYFI